MGPRAATLFRVYAQNVPQNTGYGTPPLENATNFDLGGFSEFGTPGLSDLTVRNFPTLGLPVKASEYESDSTPWIVGGLLAAAGIVGAALYFGQKK